MLATGILCPAVTVTPLSFNVPAAGSVDMITALSVLPSTSVKPKSAAANVLLPSSKIVIVLLVALGASFIGVTLMVNVAAALISTPPFATPPLSWTLKPMLE